MDLDQQLAGLPLRPRSLPNVERIGAAVARAQGGFHHGLVHAVSWRRKRIGISTNPILAQTTKAEVEGLPYHGITPALIGPGDRDLLQVPEPVTEAQIGGAGRLLYLPESIVVRHIDEPHEQNVRDASSDGEVEPPPAAVAHALAAQPQPTAEQQRG